MCAGMRQFPAVPERVSKPACLFVNSDEGRPSQTGNPFHLAATTGVEGKMTSVPALLKKKMKMEPHCLPKERIVWVVIDRGGSHEISRHAVVDRFFRDYFGRYIGKQGRWLLSL